MGETNGATAGASGFKLLCLKLILGAVAAIVGLILMRVLGGAEFVVATLIGIVPGLAEKSAKKAVAGAALGFVGYYVGAHVGAAAGAAAWNPLGGVPLFHWSVTGGFIGLTSAVMADIVALTGGALIANVASVTMLIIETVLFRR